MDSTAYNFDMIANVDDGSCLSVEMFISNLENMNSNVDSVNSVLANELDIILQAYSILEVQFEECQPDLYGQITVDLNQGWNMIGYTLINPSAPEDQFSHIVDKLFILKDNDGHFYWPYYNYNGMGDLIPGYGYQLRMIDSVNGFVFD
jgi:hypothetical protein